MVPKTMPKMVPQMGPKCPHKWTAHAIYLPTKHGGRQAAPFFNLLINVPALFICWHIWDPFVIPFFELFFIPMSTLSSSSISLNLGSYKWRQTSQKFWTHLSFSKTIWSWFVCQISKFSLTGIPNRKRSQWSSNNLSRSYRDFGVDIILEDSQQLL